MKSAKTKHRFATVSWFIGCLIFSLAVWLDREYDNVSIDQFLYQIKTPVTGADQTLTFYAIAKVSLLCILLTAIGLMIYAFCNGRFKKLLKNSCRYLAFCKSRISRFILNHALPISLASVVFAFGFFTVKLRVPDYVSAMVDQSDFIEEHYVDPNNVTMTFPQEKRNLVYIFLESMESTFVSPIEGTPITDNFIPELATLADNHLHFSNTDSLGGAYSYAGTTWTASAMVAQTAGMPIQVPLSADNYGGKHEYMPGLVSLGEILQREGYRQTLLLGSNASFAARDTYFSEHGNYTILDIEVLKAQGRLPKDYREWWGFEDRKLFAFAKEELTALAASGEPFNFTMLTADTHFPDGYVCDLCEEHYEESYPNVLRCSSSQVWDFINWIKEQPFYANTTVILAGDHLTMDPAFFENIEESAERTVYNCFINSAAKPRQTTFRRFGTFDMFPTTLSAMGVDIQGDRLALGTDLFSDTPTLTERYGFEVLDEELQKHSDFYKTYILGEPSGNSSC